MLGVVSFLIDVANVISSAAGPASALHDQPDANSDDCDQIIACPPLVDVLEEEDELVVLIEVPGCYSEDFQFDVCEDVLTVKDEDDRECHEILLPQGYDLTDPTNTCFNNGVITLRYRKIADLVCCECAR